MQGPARIFVQLATASLQKADGGRILYIPRVTNWAIWRIRPIGLLMVESPIPIGSNSTNCQYKEFRIRIIHSTLKYQKQQPSAKMDELSYETRKDLISVRSIVNAGRRCWCFTANNPRNYFKSPEDFMNSFVTNCAHRLRYAVFQEEKGKENSHYQGYIEFNQMVRFKWCANALGGHCHLEARRGTRQQARDYCMKLETRVRGPWEYGLWKPGGQGARADLLEVSDMVCAGGTLQDVSKEFPIQFIKYHRGITKLISLNIEVRTVAPTIVLCFGKTGTGKTRWAYDSYPNLYRKPCDTRWFDSYAGQKTLLLDDFGGASSKMSLNYVLQLLDRYPIQVEVKGDYIGLQATTIILTTNLHPKTWYDYSKREEQFNALARRFHKVLWFHTFGEPPKPVSIGTFFQDWWEDCSEDVYLIEETQEIKEESTSTQSSAPIVIDLTTSSSENEEDVDSSLDLFL